MEKNIKNRRYLVVGSGISGIAAANLLESQGARVELYDGNRKLTAEEIKAKLPAKSRVECHAGEVPEDAAKADCVVLSPGVPADLPWICEIREKGIPVIGELELGCLLEQGSIAAITGTNGKTTTTTLVGEIMKAHLGKEKVFVVGNIGNPYTAEVQETRKDTVTVAEVSSFQLETVRTFHPKASAILNITPDHLDRHHTMEAYVAAKEAIARRQTKEDVCVLNYDDPYTRKFGERCRAQVVYFSSSHRLSDGYFLDGDTVCFAHDGSVEKLMDIHSGMTLVGIHNVENVMAAMAVGRGMGVPMDTILKVIKTFRAVAHRIEYVATKRGVDYYDDSKGTNPDAAIRGICAMSRPTVLIGGGYDKQSEYDEWVKCFEGRVKWLVLIGQTKEKIAECAKKYGFDRIRFAETYEECLQLCTSLAQEGDAVLLSPACASWGMFPNYEVRGDMFKEYVNGLED